ncbi:MAG: YitT family protein [Clostridia bacterium]|nr:YitT family protein [Clostridia bacterium]
MNKWKWLPRVPLWLRCLFAGTVASADAWVCSVWVYPNDFAPDGVQGVATLLQEVTGVSVGVFLVLLNAPLFVFAFTRLSPSYAVKSAVYVLSFAASSLGIRMLKNVLPVWEVRAESVETLLLIAMGYGLFNGTAYVFTVLTGGSTGGTDILAQLIGFYRPRYNTVWILFLMKLVIAVSSFFVYGMRILPVLVSIVCALFGSLLSDAVFKGQSTALKFEIITDKPFELAAEIMEKLAHGCTALSGKGMYGGKEKTLLICVVANRQKYDMESILSRYDDAFSYCYAVKATYGSFDF